MEEIYFEIIPVLITVVSLLIATRIDAKASQNFKNFKEKLSQASELAKRISGLVKEIESALEDKELDKEELKKILSKLEGVTTSLRIFLL